MDWSPCAYVYGLRFEGENAIFYVGSAKNMASRMKAHTSYKPSRIKYPYQKYIMENMAQGKVLQMDCLEVSNIKDVHNREAFWIWKLSDQVFNRVSPSWTVFTEGESEQIKRLEETIAQCKSEVSKLYQKGFAKAGRLNSKLRAKNGWGAEKPTEEKCA